MRGRPNVLFLMSDEHRYDVAGFAGDRVVRTPTLDWIAESGVVFDNAYSPSPICIPARQCMATGLYPSSCGVLRYGDDLPPGSPTFARAFSEHAYYTAACGKLHHSGQDQMQGWIRRVTMEDQIVTPRYLITPDQAAFEARPRVIEDELGNLSGTKWTMQKEIRRSGAGTSPYSNWDELAAMGAEYLVAELLVSLTYDKPVSSPLLLYVGFANPHYPMIAPEKLFSWYLNRVEPRSNTELPGNRWHHRPDNAWRGPVSVGPRGDVTVRDERRALAGYYANVEAMDQRFGRVLDSLRAAGEDLDEWIIVYTSDHGDMLGEHGFWEKHSFYEGSVRVPLVIRFPARFEGARRVDRNVSLCDLYPTLCELAGLPVREDLDGRSLVALLNGDEGGWDDAVYSELDGDSVMVKSGWLKYCWYGEGYPEELFDLASDPGENRDLAERADSGSLLSRFRDMRDEFLSTAQCRRRSFESSLRGGE